MSTENVEATKYTCDNPSCGVSRLSSEGVPFGWFLFHTRFSGSGHFCSRGCIAQVVSLMTMEQRDTGGGWIVSDPWLRLRDADEAAATA